MDSYVYKLQRAGFVGVSRGFVSPIRMERKISEEIVIRKSPTYDPNDPGLANLSPN